MLRRPSSAVWFLLALLFLAFPRVAAAQAPDAPAKPRLNFSLASTMAPPAASMSTVRFDPPSSSEPSTGSSKLLAALYATTALTQGLDAHSTLTALNAGATERNPLMSYLTSHPP